MATRNKGNRKFWYYYMDNDDKVRKTTLIEMWVKYGPRRKHWQIQTMPRKGVRVSTVFLGLDYSFGKGKKPILFETMVFGGRNSGATLRYPNREKAEQGHKEIAAQLKETGQISRPESLPFLCINGLLES